MIKLPFSHFEMTASDNSLCKICIWLNLLIIVIFVISRRLLSLHDVVDVAQPDGNANDFEFVLKLHLFIIAKALLSPFLRFGNYFVFCDVVHRHCRKSTNLVPTSFRTSRKIE